MSDEQDLFDLFQEIDNNAEPHTRDQKLIKGLFGWPGGKWRSCKKILPLLPYTPRFVDTCMGSGIITINRKPCKMEVCNDANSGITDFFRCIKSDTLAPRMMEFLRHTIHSREEWQLCKETWQKVDDPAERAARWYYMIQYSFAKLGRNWGRTTSPAARVAGLVRDKLKLFPAISERFKDVQVDNQDVIQCLLDYDHPDTVFYVDPDYEGTDSGIYKHHVDHPLLLKTISNLQSFVAVSGYANPLYDDQDFWDQRHVWDSYVSTQSLAYQESSNKANLKGLEKRGNAQEVLWIKEAA